MQFAAVATKRRVTTHKPDIDIILALPEAPKFRPTAEEFKDPLAYIESIRAVAEPFGICKIQPPPSWAPPDALALLRNIRFTVRTQNLALLDADARARAHFTVQCRKFLALNGIVYSDELASVNRRLVDLCLLHRAVVAAGGVAALAVLERSALLGSPDDIDAMRHLNWFRLAPAVWPDEFDERRVPTRSARVLIGAHFARIHRDFVQPWIDFKAAKSSVAALQAARSSSSRSGMRQVPPPSSSGMRHVPPPSQAPPLASHPHASAPHAASAAAPLLAPQPAPPLEPAARAAAASARRMNNEMFGAPAASGQPTLYDRPPPSIVVSSSSEGGLLDNDDGTEHLVCEVCKSDSDDQMMLLCDDCNYGFHGACLDPPILAVPATQWFCESCLGKCRFGDFAFDQDDTLYTLDSFRDRATAFKIDHFGNSYAASRRGVAFEAIEREFWRIVTTGRSREADDDSSESDQARRVFNVQYGADLHTTVHGSGFPHGNSMLGRSEWNLNNIALSRNSMLRMCNSAIDGVTRPWLYVGMVFSAFCWHNEDHYLPSINYLHAGAEKRWFGIAGVNAPQFEAVMRSVAPELFEEQPDLLQQLVTILSPACLVRAGVPVVQLTQGVGEFVVTFPAAYHAGYNTGFNIAEAVNFAMADWIPFGALCRSMYRRLRRPPVFSYVELLCNIARSLPPLRTAIWLHASLAPAIDAELAARAAARNEGYAFERRAASWLQQCKELACGACADALFLSAVACKRCSAPPVAGKTDDARVVAACLEHREQLCECDRSHHVVLYRDEDSELRALAATVAGAADAPAAWLRLVAPLFSARSERSDQQDVSALWLSIGDLLARGRLLLEQLDVPPLRENTQLEPPDSVLQMYRFEPSTVPPFVVQRELVASLRERLRTAIATLGPLVGNIQLIQKRLAAIGHGQSRVRLTEALEVQRCASLMPFLFDAIHVQLIDNMIRQAQAVEPRLDAALKALTEALGGGGGGVQRSALEAARGAALEVLAVADATRVDLTAAESLRVMLRQTPPAMLAISDLASTSHTWDARAVEQASWCERTRAALSSKQLSGTKIAGLIASQEGSTEPEVRQLVAELRSQLTQCELWDSSALELFAPLHQLCNGSLAVALSKPHFERSEKKPTVDSVCVCRGSPQGMMLHCGLCDDIYHAACVGFDIRAKLPARYLCPLCFSTRRPRFRDVVALCVRARTFSSVPDLFAVVESHLTRACEWLARARACMASAQRSCGVVKALLDEADGFELTIDITPSMAAFVAESEMAAALALANGWVRELESGVPLNTDAFAKRLLTVMEVSVTYMYSGAIDVLRAFVRRAHVKRGAPSAPPLQDAALVQCRLCDCQYAAGGGVFACHDCRLLLGGPPPEPDAKKRQRIGDVVEPKIEPKIEA